MTNLLMGASLLAVAKSIYYQITGVRIQDPLKAQVYKIFENEEFVALLKILIASRRLHYQIKRSLKRRFVYMFLLISTSETSGCWLHVGNHARALFLSAFLMKDKYKFCCTKCHFSWSETKLFRPITWEISQKDKWWSFLALHLDLVQIFWNSKRRSYIWENVYCHFTVPSWHLKPFTRSLRMLM